jgi:hypothetical protein
MSQLFVNTTVEELKAVNGIVIDAEQWLQAAWDGKAASCMKRVILEESKLNPSKMTDQERKDWIKSNNFKTRVEKDG